MPPKKVQTTIKLQLSAGKATPAPPVGTALGPHGVNIMDFCKQFNAKTQKEPDGMIFPVLVTIYTDRSYTFILKTPPASVLRLRRTLCDASCAAQKDRCPRRLQNEGKAAVGGEGDPDRENQPVGF